MLQQDLANRLR